MRAVGDVAGRREGKEGLVVGLCRGGWPRFSSVGFSRWWGSKVIEFGGERNREVVF